MSFFEKYRDYSLISKIIACALFFDAGTTIFNMLVNSIRWEFYSFSIWTVIYQAVPIIAGVIFFMNKHQDKMFRLIFSGAYVLVRLIYMIRTIAIGSPSFISILTSFLSLVFSAAFALYYLGVIKPAGRKNYFIVMYALIGVSALFSIFNHPISSVSTFAMCSLLAMYGYQETRAANSTMIYAGMIGTAYYVVYSVLGDLLSVIRLIPDVHLYLPGFFSSMNILLCLAMPFLVFDRVVPGEGQPFGFDFGALTGQPAQQYAQPMQQNGFAQPVQNQYQQPAQPMQSNFDPMTGQPLNPQPTVQQNNFDPMTGQPIQPQQNNFDPMTGQPIDPNNGQ